MNIDKMTKKQKQEICKFFSSITGFSYRGKTYDVSKIKFSLTLRENKFWKQYKNGNKYNYTLTINDEKLPLKAKFKLEYNCISCGHKCVIINNFRLVNKLLGNNVLRCVHCIQKLDHAMRKYRSNMMHGHKPVKGTVYNRAKAKNVRPDFSDMPAEWISSYFERNYTVKEFNKMLSDFSVVSINGYDLKNLDYTYIPYAKTFNENAFAPKIVIDGKIQSIQKMECMCKICGNPYSFHFKKKDTVRRKTKNICRNCMEYYLVNSTWKVQDTVNCIGEKVTYQSSIELEFINLCNRHGIVVVDGPVLDYEFKGVQRKYHVDFFIPCLNELIEIKAMHKFQRDDIASGKFQAKCNVAEQNVSIGRYNAFSVLYDYQMTKSWEKEFVSKCANS